MIRAALLAIALLFAAAPALAQGANAAEISFWESVRDTKNPAELRAYLQQYPNGVFKALAETRLAALEKAAPAVAARPPVAAPPPLGPARMPQTGDTWTYRLSYPTVRGQWGRPDRAPSTHVVTVGEVKDGRIVDLLSVDGATQTQVAHSSEVYLVPEGVSIFSPYLIAFRNLPARGSIGSIAILDTPCGGHYRCRATGRVAGTETISVPAGQFVATKVVIEESWQAASGSTIGIQTSQMNGGRTLTIWYVPQLKRAAKFASRIIVGDIPAVEPTFDLELVSYQVK